jgi:hypothetical protein
MAKRVGRPALPSGQKRVQIAGRVMPETAAYLTREQQRSGKSLGALLDEAVVLYQCNRIIPSTD